MPLPRRLQGTIDIGPDRRNGPSRGRATVTGGNNERLKGSIKGDVARRERLAQELRENLKRRKAKARAQTGTPAKSSDDSDASAR